MGEMDEVVCTLLLLGFCFTNTLSPSSALLSQSGFWGKDSAFLRGSPGC